MSSNILRWYGVTYKGNYYVKNTKNIYYPPVNEVSAKKFCFLSEAEEFAEKLNNEIDLELRNKEKLDHLSLLEKKIELIGFNNLITLSSYKSSLLLEASKILKQNTKIKEILSALEEIDISKKESLISLNEISAELSKILRSLE